MATATMCLHQSSYGHEQVPVRIWASSIPRRTSELCSSTGPAGNLLANHLHVLAGSGKQVRSFGLGDESNRIVHGTVALGAHTIEVGD